MGLLRFIFALSVLIAHMPPEAFFGIKLVGGIAAVQSFYMISGFYMALILNEKYHSYKLFFSNRLLKLFPIYWTVLVGTVCLIIIYPLCGQQPLPVNWNRFTEMSLPVQLYIIFINACLFGQDTTLFLQLNTAGSLVFTSNFLTTGSTQPAVWTYLFVPQAWTLSIELLFYLLAPWLVKRSWQTLSLLVLASLALRVYIYIYLGWQHDPWIYRFFPTELAFFLLGTLAYKSYKFYQGRNLTRPTLQAITLSFITATLFFQFAPDRLALGEEAIRWLYYTLFFVCLPFIFLYTKNSKTDTILGELSYPMYICHIFVFIAWGYAQGALAKIPLISGLATSYLLQALGTILLAGLLNQLCKPLENYRQQRSDKSEGKHHLQRAE